MRKRNTRQVGRPSGRGKRAGAPSRKNKTPNRPFAAVLAVVVALLASGSLVAAITGARRGHGMQTPLPLAVQRIYAGSRMLASEQPAVAPLPAPTNVVATANSASSITISWTAPSSGTVTSYNILRRVSLSDTGTILPTNSAATNYTDAVASATYLYQVQATGSGPPSQYTPLTSSSLATAYSLGISSGVLTGQPILASQINSIRTALNKVLAAAQLSPMSSISSGAAIHATDLSQMQQQLTNAYTALGIGAPSFNRTISAGLAVQAADYVSVANATRAAQ